jgi:hypothetical protein
MLVVFKCRAYGNITMFSDNAVKLLNLMGRSGKVPGAIAPENIPEALGQLKTALAAADTVPVVTEASQEKEVEFIDEPVSLRNRAFPLLELLEAAVAEDVPVIWEEGS